MTWWLGGDWSITLVLTGGEVAGYAVYQVRRDEYCPDQQLVYVHGRAFWPFWPKLGFRPYCTQYQRHAGKSGV